MTTIQTIAIALFSVALILVAFNLVRELVKAINVAVILEKAFTFTLASTALSFLAYGIFTAAVNLF